MNTLHVFTGVEIGLIPPARKKLLRAVARVAEDPRAAGRAQGASPLGLRPHPRRFSGQDEGGAAVALPRRQLS